MKILKLFLLILAPSLFVAACGETAGPTNNSNVQVKTNSATQTTPPPAQTPDEITLGKEVYALNCMVCHQDSGKGGKVTVDGKTLKPDDLTSEKMKSKTDEKLISYVVDGVPDEGMPSFKDKLSEGDIRAVVKHVRSLQGL